MEQALIEMVKNAPWAVALILVVRMFLQAEKEREIQRVADAKEAGEKQRNHELQLANIQRGNSAEVNNFWASTVKNMMEKNQTSFEVIVDALGAMRKEIVESYEKLGVTKDLWKIAKDELKTSRNKEKE